MPQPKVDVERAIKAATAGPFQGRVWRVHWREVAADDWRLSLRSSGRYHRGLDLFPPSQAFAALYTSLAPEIAIWEMVRRSAARNLAYLRNNILTEIEVDLERVLDVSNPSTIGATRRDFTGPDLEPCQQIAATARSLRLDGLLVPSATLLGLNLVLFPDNLVSPGSLHIGRSTELPLDAIVDRQHDDEPSQEP